MTPTRKPSKPLIIKVPGAYIVYPKKISARAEPIPPENPPIIGPNNNPQIITPASPILINPCVAGIGIHTTIVSTQIRAENTPINENRSIIRGVRRPLN